MKKTGDKFTRFLWELSRRRTMRVAAGYIVLAWVAVEVASVVLPAFEAPDWALPSLIIAAAVGLPLALILSWIFDITPDGFERTPDYEPAGGAEDPQPADAPAPADDALPETIKPSLALPLGAAQRRQVSLLRCTFLLLEDGRSLRDPEALLALAPELERLVDGVAERFSGHRLNASADSCELLFGWPTAFENDAQRAVTASLAIIQEVARMPPAAGGRQLGASIGVHSDLAVIEDEGAGGGPRIVGDTAQVAAWLQTHAPAGTVALGEATRELLRGQIECEPLGEYTNASLGLTLQVHRALRVTARSLSGAQAQASRRPVHGRETELALIQDRWQLARDGEDQFVVLRGEPGLGKSTVVEQAVERIRGEDPEVFVLPVYCSPFETNNPFFPLFEALRGTGLLPGTGEPDADSGDALLETLRAGGVAPERLGPLREALAAGGERPGGAEAGGQSAEAFRGELLDGLLALFAGAARRRPLLAVFEDLHWADPSTREFLSLLIGNGTGAGALCLLTTRPDAPLEWQDRAEVTLLDLQKLPRRVTEQLVREVLGGADVDDELVDRIVAETGGNPLFTEELARSVAESAGSERDAPAQLSLPGTLKQLLASRVDSVGESRPLLQLCSMLGSRFDYSLLKSVSETENEQALQDELRSLVDGGFLVQEGAAPQCSYRFRHSLLQESARSSLLRATRTELHAKIAAVLEIQFPARAEGHPELLAYHHGEGDQHDRAVHYWILAARNSLQAFAIREAVDQARHGLSALDRLPASAQRETARITLLSLLGKGLLTLRGYADPRVEKTFAEALSISENLGDVPQLFQLVVGLWMYYFIGGEAAQALSVARRLLRMAAAAPSPARHLQARYCLGYSLYRLGRFREALGALEEALAAEEAGVDYAAESPSGDDTRIHVRCILAHVLWHLAEDDRALALLREARELAQGLGNPYGVVFCAFMSSWVHVERREAAAAAELAGETVQVAADKGFRFFLPLGNFVRAWASGQGDAPFGEGEARTRVETMETCLERFTGSGAKNGETAMGLTVAEAWIEAGAPECAARWVAEVRRRMETSGERYLAPELLRIEGLLAARSGRRAEAEQRYLDAQATARDSGSVALARRATDAIAALQDPAATPDAELRTDPGRP